MNFFKKISAGALALVLLATATACSDTSYIGKVDGEDVAAGVYIYYQYQALTEATSHEDFDKTLGNVLDNVIEDKKMELWVNDKAVQNLQCAAEVQNQMEQYGLTLSEDDIAAIDYNVESYWSSYADTLESMGISESSYREIVTASYESSTLFEYMYGEDGPNAVADEDLTKYFESDYANFKQIPFSYLDEEGEVLGGTEKDAVKADAQAFLDKVSADTENIDTLIEEYSLSKMTDEEKEKYEESGADKEKDYMLTIQKDTDSYYVSPTLSTAIFKSAKVGEPVLLSDEKAFYVVLRYDVMEDPESYAEMKNSLLFNLKSEEFEENLFGICDNISLEMNASALSRYKVKNLL